MSLKFIISGFYRSGTTSIWKNLKESKNINNYDSKIEKEFLQKIEALNLMKEFTYINQYTGYFKI